MPLMVHARTGSTVELVVQGSKTLVGCANFAMVIEPADSGFQGHFKDGRAVKLVRK
jgi:hypothetical protein